MSSDFKNLFKGEMINLNPLGLGSPPIYNGAYSLGALSVLEVFKRLGCSFNNFLRKL